MAPRKPDLRSKKRKFKKTSPPPRLSTAQIRRLTVDGKAVTDAPFAPDARRGMKDMPAGYAGGGGVGKKKVDITNMSVEELDRYIQQLKEPLVVKPVKKKEGGAMKTPKVLPKPKPKTSTNKKTGATRGAGDDKEYMRKAARANMNKGGGLNAAIKRVKRVQGMREGGTPISDADRALLGSLLGDAKRTMEITPEMREAGRALQRSGKIPRPPRPKNRRPTLEEIKRMRNFELIRDGIEMKPAPKKMEDGGAVPKKFKGFSKLPEDVQQQMNPTLAAKYEDGGAVRGMGRAYMGKPRKVKIR